MVLSTVSRAQHQGAPDPQDPATRAEIAALLPDAPDPRPGGRADRRGDAARSRPGDRSQLHALRSVRRSPDRAAGRLSYRSFSRGATTRSASSASPAKRGGCIRARSRRTASRRLLQRQTWTAQHEQALDQLFTDRYSGKWFLQSRNQPRTQEADAAAIRERFGLDADKKTATVFSHVLWDANLFYGEDLFQDYGEWFVETVRARGRQSRTSTG